MKQRMAFITALFLTTQVPAEEIDREPLLDKVVFQTEARLWVNTETALVRVQVNATLTQADLLKVRNDILTNLNKIAKGVWQITQFNRSQDNSGLEKLYVQAEARVPQSLITNVYKEAKGVSKPGITYAIEAIEFTPSLEEISNVKTKVRENLYQKITEELKRLNTIYPEQHYSVNRIYFNDMDASQVKPMQERLIKTTMLSAASSQNLAISNELTLSATVELASTRKTGSAVVANK